MSLNDVTIASVLFCLFVCLFVLVLHWNQTITPKPGEVLRLQMFAFIITSVDPSAIRVVLADSLGLGELMMKRDVLAWVD